MASFVKYQLCTDDNGHTQPDHLFNLIDLEYERGTSIVEYYKKYRNLFVASLMQKGENNRVLLEHEQVSTIFEDLIFVNVLDLIDKRLPELVHELYQHLIGKSKTLMDYKDEILAKVPTLLSGLERSPCAIFLREVHKVER